MTNDRFFRGFFAALRLQGVEKIVVGKDEHHKRFQAVANALNDRVDRNPRLDLPCFLPSLFTGRFRELDETLITSLDTEGVGTPLACFTGMSVTRAGAVLEHLALDEREIVWAMAKVYWQQEVGV